MTRQTARARGLGRKSREEIGEGNEGMGLQAKMDEGNEGRGLGGKRGKGRGLQGKRCGKWIKGGDCGERDARRE